MLNGTRDVIEILSSDDDEGAASPPPMKKQRQESTRTTLTIAITAGAEKTEEAREVSPHAKERIALRGTLMQNLLLMKEEEKSEVEPLREHHLKNITEKRRVYHDKVDALKRDLDQEIKMAESSFQSKIKEIESKRAENVAKATKEVEQIAAEVAIHVCTKCKVDFFASDPECITVTEENKDEDRCCYGDRCPKCAKFGTCEFCDKDDVDDLMKCGDCEGKGCYDCVEGLTEGGCSQCADWDGPCRNVCQGCFEALNEERCGARTCDECHDYHVKYCSCPKSRW